VTEDRDTARFDTGDDSDEMAPERVKASLRRLAGPDDAEIVDRAAEATGDLEAAAAFVESVGLDGLRAAVEATDDPERRERGRRALAAFREFRAAASGAGGHFHPGRDTNLRRDDEGQAE